MFDRLSVGADNEGWSQRRAARGGENTWSGVRHSTASGSDRLHPSGSEVFHGSGVRPSHTWLPLGCSRSLPLAVLCLDHRSVGDDAVLGHDDDPVADVVAGTVGVLDTGLVDEPDVGADAGVLVDDRAADVAAVADADADTAVRLVV